MQLIGLGGSWKVFVSFETTWFSLIYSRDIYLYILENSWKNQLSNGYRFDLIILFNYVINVENTYTYVSISRNFQHALTIASLQAGKIYLIMKKKKSSKHTWKYSYNYEIKLSKWLKRGKQHVYIYQVCKTN